jgi:hypothetical protein
MRRAAKSHSRAYGAAGTAVPQAHKSVVSIKCLYSSYGPAAQDHINRQAPYRSILWEKNLVKL